MDYMPVVVDATYLTDYKIKITFDNGEQKIADCQKWFPLVPKFQISSLYTSG